MPSTGSASSSRVAARRTVRSRVSTRPFARSPRARTSGGTGGTGCTRSGGRTRRDRARPAIEKALEVDDRDASLWRERGAIYRAMGRAPDALASYEAAIERNPEEAGAGRAEEADAGGEKAAILADERKHDAAVEAFGAVLEILPSDPVALRGRKKALLDLADWP